MKNLLILLSIILFIACENSTTNQVEEKEATWISYAKPAELGINPDSLKKIDEVIKEMTSEGKIPGAAALVAKNGKIVYQTAYGFQDVKDSTSMDTTDIFRIASMTKPIVTVAIMQLYEDGKLKLTDPVSKYISSFADPKVLVSFNKEDTTWESRDASREITLHDLLTHTAGVAYGFVMPSFGAIYAKAGIPDLAVASSLTIAETMDKMGELPLIHDPGAKFSYGLNTDVLGRVVEVASGQDLEAYVKKNITGPLKMNDTRFFYEQDISERLTTVYTINPKDSAIMEMEVSEVYDPEYPNRGAKQYYSGGSGMSSTLTDYFIFSQMLLNGGSYNGVEIINDSTVQLMAADQLGEVRFSDYNTFGYGLRVNRERNADGTPGAVIDLGWSGAFNTYFMINPKDSVVGVVMSQVLMNPYGGELNRGFIDAVEIAY